MFNFNHLIFFSQVSKFSLMNGPKQKHPYTRSIPKNRKAMFLYEIHPYDKELHGCTKRNKGKEATP